jgi:two-component system sensor histidine kinase VanS
VAEDATEALVPLAEQRVVTIEVSGEAAPTTGSYPLLLQMVTNLVQNAIVHNLPDHGTVWVKAGVQRGDAVLVVENTGERLDRKLVDTLVEPFQRGTARTRTDDAGVGLGLAIVKHIADVLGGTLTLTARDAGGLCVMARVPLRSASARP